MADIYGYEKTGENIVIEALDSNTRTLVIMYVACRDEMHRWKLDIDYQDGRRLQRWAASLVELIPMNEG